MTNTEKIISDFFIKREGKEILNHLHQIDFIDSGYIDSLDLLVLADYIEESFNIKIDLTNEDTFKAVRKFQSLVKLIEQKKK
tara:strand:- start:144 stop:389 length:246 start_codon:yes stop_codon:yes gene_type:complete